MGHGGFPFIAMTEPTTIPALRTIVHEIPMAVHGFPAKKDDYFVNPL
jgi:hypothetical protein